MASDLLEDYEGETSSIQRLGEEKKAEERSGGYGSALAGAYSQDERSEEVEKLIGAAKRTAQVQMGGSDVTSQWFHHRISEMVADLLGPNQQGRKVGDLGYLLDDVLSVLNGEVLCKQKSTAGKKSIFPLPAPEHLFEEGPRTPFLRAMARALNSMHGETQFSRPTQGGRRVMKRLEGVLQGSVLLDEELPQVNFPSFFKHKGIDYQGEEIQVAKRIKWESIEPSLPDQVATLDLRDFCEGGVRYYVDHFEEFLLPVEDQMIGKTPSIMVDNEEWEILASGLVSKGLCSVLPIDELYTINQQPLHNGMFAVSKQEFKGNIEICRLIMNLKPVNLNCKGLEGDTCTLPAVTQMGHCILTDDEVLCTSSEDIRCFFYLFSVPEAWIRFMSFGKEVPKKLIPEDRRDTPHYLASKVLPMGFVNSVAIAQHVHRNVVRRCMGSLQPPIGGHQEMRRDRVHSHHPNLFRIYLDNFDQVKRVDRKTAGLIEGQVSEEVAKLREAYEREGLPRHPKKAVSQSLGAEVQGAWVDGNTGVVLAKPSKVAKYIRLGLELLKQGKASQKELQVVGGGFVYISMFRRPLLGSLNQIWRSIVALEGKPRGMKVILKKEVMVEIARFIALVLLGYMDLRLPFDPVVTASDASTTGGGVSMSRGLTGYGLSAASSLVRGDEYEHHDFIQVLAIGLFDGISALRVALDILQAPIAGHVSIEKSGEANRVVEANFPDTLHVSSVEEVTEDMVIGWSLKFSSVGLVLLGSGPPCQGVSGLNWDRKGALRDSRSSLFWHVPRIVNLCKKVFSWAQVHSLAESVASMDWEDCQAMNEGFEDQPWFVDADGVSLCHRPRVYWVSWEISEDSEGVDMLWGSGDRLPLKGEIKLSATVDESSFLEPGWKRKSPKPFPTFTTSRPSPQPLRRPAGLKDCEPHEKLRWQEDLHRFPPYQYKDNHCLQSRDGSLRPPSVLEREVILGFPAGYTRQCLPKSQHETTQHRDLRLALLGNSWSIPVISFLLHELLYFLGLIPFKSVQDIVDAITPGKGVRLQTLLLRPPLKQATSTFAPSAKLVEKLSGPASIKGEDLLLQSKSEVPVKFHRLRTSVPAKLWRWQTVAGWKWKGEAEHINVLELRAVLTSLRWRAEHLEQLNIKSLHLVDSLVVLHALTRGRSSSRKLRRTLLRIDSLLLACNFAPIWSYVDTKQNPADKPSRWGVRKGWLKVKQKWSSLAQKKEGSKNANS